MVQPAAEEVVTAFAVRFLIDKYNIEDDQKLNIDRMARYLKRHPEARLELTDLPTRRRLIQLTI